MRALNENQQVPVHIYMGTPAESSTLIDSILNFNCKFVLYTLKFITMYNESLVLYSCE